jgi:hypothetical protein
LRIKDLTDDDRHLDRLSKLNNQLSETPGKQSVIKSLRDNLLVYAFWSCLQLERFVHTPDPTTVCVKLD